MTATAREMAELIGQRGFVEDAPRRVSYAVEVIDVRETFNQVHVLVTPLSGAGQAWVALSSVEGVELPAATS